MIDIKNIRVGDRGTLKPFTVTQLKPDGLIQILIDGHLWDNLDHYNSVAISAIASIEPRQLKVGKARFRGVTTSDLYDILAINGEYAWVKHERHGYDTIKATSLENI